MDGYRVAAAGDGLGSAEEALAARMVAAVDEYLFDALSCASTEEAIKQVEAIGLTKTAEQLRRAKARGQLISIRTREGLAVAHSEGRKGGRRHKLTPEQVVEARGWIDRGEKTVTSVAALFNVSRQTIYRALEGDSGSATASSASTAPSSRRR